MREMGVSHGRGANIGGGPGVLGYAKGDRLMATKSATPESVIEHELGHILDARLGLWRELHDYGGTEPKSKEAIAYRKKITLELRALADLRHEGIEDIPASQQAYERSRPEKIANAMMGLLHAPERMREVAPTVDARLREILARDPVTAKLLDIKPSFRHGANTFDVKTEGMVVLGHHYAPEPVARVLNNYLSPGLSESAIGPFFDVYRGAGNLLNMVQLGFSGFHLMFTSLDAIVSQNALGVLQGREALRALTHGDLSTAGRRAKEALTNVVTSPAAPITTAIKGARVGRAYYGGTDDPGLAQIIDGLEAGGGRAKMDEFYGGTAWRKFRLALHEGASTDLEPVARGKKLANAGAELLPATIEKSSAWLMQHVVPAQKRGVFFDLAQFELSKLPPGADRMQVRTAMARAWDSVENRMGQLTYNNLFWNRWLKDGLMASIRSVGWNVGTIREIGGGAIDVARSPLKSTSSLAHEAGQRFVLTPRASYFVSLPITVGLAGGLVHYLATGHVPSSLKDWYYPGTGQKNADGSDERGQLASYLRDMRDATTAPWQTVKNKLNPAVSLTLDMLNNKDFFGDKIRNEQDPLVQQLAQEARYILGQATPLGVRNLREGLARGQSLGTAAQSLVGITPAPRAVVRSEALNRMHDFLSARGGGVGLTPEQQGARRERTDLMGRLRQHEPDAGAAVGGAVSSGTISVDAAKRTLRTSAAPGAVAQFQRLTLPEALEVYRIATTEERQQFGSVLSDKLKRARPGQYSGKDLERIRNGIRALQPQR
jgi:hypothetical protein